MLIEWKPDFGNPQGAILGIIVAAFSFGSVIAIPFVPWVNDRFGRKTSILVGSCFIMVGVVLQTASINREFCSCRSIQAKVR
jgi:MFS family permease